MTEFTVGQPVWVRSSGEAPAQRGFILSVSRTGYGRVTGYKVQVAGDIFDCYPDMLEAAE